MTSWAHYVINVVLITGSGPFRRGNERYLSMLWHCNFIKTIRSERTWRNSQRPAFSSIWVCFSDVSGKWGQPLNLAPLCSEFQPNPQKHRARTPEMTNPRQLAQPGSTRVLIGAVNTPAYSSGHGCTHPRMHMRSHGWLHLIESWSNLIFHSFATMAAIEEPVTCLNLCRHPVTGTLGIWIIYTSELTLVLRF